MELQTLLVAAGFDLARTALCLHKPSDLRERTALTIAAETQLDLFDAYQSTHARQPEATLKGRDFMASFLTRGDGTLVFIGFYQSHGCTDRTPEEFGNDPLFQRMSAQLYPSGHQGVSDYLGLDGRAEFDLRPLPELAELKGRLIVNDPGGRTYMRLAETTPLSIVEITREAQLSPPMPAWNELVLDAQTLRSVPTQWAQSLRHWRGIYLILDTTDGARYVGAAYGVDNLLGRWRTHVAGDLGVTRELARRNPDNFRFSILELLSPTTTIDEVTQLELHWMTRLHTKEHGLNR